MGPSNVLPSLSDAAHVRKVMARCRSQGALSLVWVPGHVGVSGNERADHGAGEGALLSGRISGKEPQGGPEGYIFLTADRIDEVRACAFARATATNC